MEYTNEQKRQVFYEGGLRDQITLSSVKLTIGEVSLKDRYKIFECMASDLSNAENSFEKINFNNKYGLIRILQNIFNWIFGKKNKNNSALNVVKEFINGITNNDYKLVLLCTKKFNKISEKQIEGIFWNATYSEVQAAIRKILEINGIDLKKLTATPKTSSLGGVAPSQMTSNAGSPELSNLQAGQENKF